MKSIVFEEEDPDGEYTIEVHMIRFPQMTEIFLSSTTIAVRGVSSRPTVVPTTSAAALAVLAAIILLIAKEQWERVRFPTRK